MIRTRFRWETRIGSRVHVCQGFFPQHVVLSALSCCCGRVFDVDFRVRGSHPFAGLKLATPLNRLTEPNGCLLEVSRAAMCPLHNPSTSQTSTFQRRPNSTMNSSWSDATPQTSLQRFKDHSGAYTQAPLIRNAVTSKGKCQPPPIGRP